MLLERSERYRHAALVAHAIALLAASFALFSPGRFSFFPVEQLLLALPICILVERFWQRVVLGLVIAFGGLALSLALFRDVAQLREAQLWFVMLSGSWAIGALVDVLLLRPHKLLIARLAVVLIAVYLSCFTKVTPTEARVIVVIGAIASHALYRAVLGRQGALATEPSGRALAFSFIAGVAAIAVVAQPLFAVELVRVIWQSEHYAPSWTQPIMTGTFAICAAGGIFALAAHRVIPKVGLDVAVVVGVLIAVFFADTSIKRIVIAAAATGIACLEMTSGKLRARAIALVALAVTTSFIAYLLANAYDGYVSWWVYAASFVRPIPLFSVALFIWCVSCAAGWTFAHAGARFSLAGIVDDDVERNAAKARDLGPISAQLGPARRSLIFGGET